MIRFTSGHPRNQGARCARATCPHRATPTRPAPKTEHARNQVGTSSADAAAAGGGQNMGRGSERRGPQAARPTVDAPRHATQDRPALSRAGHHSSHAGAAIVPLAPAVRGAPPCHRPRLRRSLSGDPFLDPAGSRSLHRRGRRAAAGTRRHAPLDSADVGTAGRADGPAPRHQGIDRMRRIVRGGPSSFDRAPRGPRAAAPPACRARSATGRRAPAPAAVPGRRRSRGWAERPARA
jgi:hypothetical protein